jgi:hypothetical protein
LPSPSFFGNLAVGIVQRTSTRISPTPMSWDEICRHPQYEGRWVALSDCRYDQETGETKSGAVVDADECLSTLCQRVRISELRDCAIVRCNTRGRS